MPTNSQLLIYCNHFGAGHTPVHQGVTGVCTQDQCAETAVGRQGLPDVVYVSAHHHHKTPPPSPPLHTPLTEPTHKVTMANDSTGYIPEGALWQKRATRAHSGKPSGDRVQLSPLESELPKAK